MKLLLLALLAFLAAVALGLYAAQDPGYVLIAYRDWTLETTLALAVVLLLVAFGLLFAAVRGLSGSLHMPARLRAWRRERRVRRARSTSKRGLIALAEGHWQAAEKLLTKNIEYCDNPLFNYLSAARAAQKQHAHERRDRYLMLAHHSMRGADVAVELTQAELQLVHGQFEQSLATLMHLRTIAPKHPYVLYLLMKLYEQLHSWDELLALLPELRKRKVIPEAQARILETKVCAERLAVAARAGDKQRLQEIWLQAPKALRQQEELIYDYARHLVCVGEAAAAEALLGDALKKQWSNRLVQLYGRVEGADPGQQLTRAEGWLKEHGNNGWLLLTLGRICMRSGLWGKAQSHLEASAAAAPRPETYWELGRLLDHLKRPEAAAGYYRKGLTLSAEKQECESLRLPAQRLAPVPLPALTAPASGQPKTPAGGAAGGEHWPQSAANSKASE